MWKDIIGWEDYYEISDNGEIRNKITNKIISGDTNSEGYHRVTLQNNKHTPNKKRCFVHRLVAEHFIPNPNNLPEVNHKDTNINNNTISNLEWVTKKENERHSRKYGSKEYKPFNVIFTDHTCKEYEFKQDLADDLHITRGAVKHWLNGVTQGYKNYGIESIGYI